LTTNTPQYEICNLPCLNSNNNWVDTEYENYDDIDANQSCISHGDLTRCWYTYIPESAKKSTNSVPIVLDLHGFTSCASVTFGYTGWANVAEKEGFVVIMPQGNMDAAVTNNTCWNAGACCCYDKNFADPLAQYANNVDDSSFLRQAISNTVESVKNDGNVTIDTTRVYFAGHSNGCMMGQSMAAQESDLVAAVCCHAGVLESDVASNYKPTPIHVAHGDLDLVVPFNHTWQSFNLTTPDNAVDNFRFWGNMNGCKKMDTIVDDSNLYSTHSFSDCNNNANVQ